MRVHDRGDEAVRLLENAVSRLAEQTRFRVLNGLSHDDADDTVGTFGTDDAAGFDPLPLLRALHEHGAEVVVMGQVAGTMHGSRELTGDLDLLWNGDAGQADALAAASASVSAHRTDGDGVPMRCEAAASAYRGCCSTRRAPAATAALCPAVGDLPVADILARCLVVVSDGFEIRYVDRADLIRMRRAAGRIKDLRHADELERLAMT